MTDPNASPPQDPAPERPILLPEPESVAPNPAAPDPAASRPAMPQEEAPPPDRRTRSDALAWLCGIGFLVLAGGIGYVGWRSQLWSPELAALQQRVAALEQRASTPANLQALEARVAALENRPRPDIKALEAGLASLQQLQARVEALQQRQAPDLAPLRAQLNAVRQEQAAGLAGLQSRVAALEKQVTAASQSAAGASQLTDRLETLDARVQALSATDQNTTAGLAHRVDAVEARLSALEHDTTELTGAVQRASRLARIEAAQLSLAEGHALGDINGAPPAVSRFATAAPPTEAALRLAFPKAAEAALSAAQPDTGSSPFFRQVLSRAEGLVTVRQGDHVLVGNPAAGVLARAQADLDAGDLAASVAAVASLSGPPAVAMEKWLAEAQAVLAARAALANLAAHA